MNIGVGWGGESSDGRFVVRYFDYVTGGLLGAELTDTDGVLRNVPEVLVHAGWIFNSWSPYTPVDGDTVEANTDFHAIYTPEGGPVGDDVFCCFLQW